MSHASLNSMKSVLSRLGWSVSTSGSVGELWSDGQGHQVGIPFQLEPETPEWNSAVERLAAYTSQSVGDLQERIDWFGYDVSKFKVDGPLLNHTVSVNAGYNLFRTAHRALRSSATTARSRKAVIGSNFSSVGDRVVERSRFGQTEEGSYLVPLLVPVGDAIQAEYHQPQIDGADVVFEKAEIEPDERRVTRTMAESLSAISNRLVKPARKPTQSQVDELVEIGVSRELLVALTDVLKPEGLSEFAVSFVWSENIDLQQPKVEASIDIPAAATEILEEATELISKFEEPASETFSGPIVELRHDRAANIGHVVIDAYRAGKKTEILVPLRGQNLEPAHRWFESRDTLFASGIVQRVSGRWQIPEPEKLYSYSDPMLPGL